MVVDAAVLVSRGTSKDRSSGPACLSGITYAGGTTYYVIADNGTDCGLYKATINLGSDGKSVSSYSLGNKISLAMVSDIEGIAYDPASGNVWVADESTQTITEFDPSSGAALRRVDVPAVMKKIVGNYGFESLTISGDGLTMWTAYGFRKLRNGFATRHRSDMRLSERAMAIPLTCTLCAHRRSGRLPVRR